MKAFLSGATGFIGSHLVDLLLARDAEVFALVRNPEKEPALLEKKVRVLRGDLFSIPALPAGLDVVFHLAGKTRALKSADYYTVNQQGTASLLQALSGVRERPRVVILSSLAAAGPSPDGRRPVLESDSPRPITHYGRSKLGSEEEALKFKDRFPITIVRAAAVYGPRDRDFLPYFKLARKGILISSTKKKEASAIYVKDLAEALYLCAKSDLKSGELINIADARPYAWEDLARVAAAVSKRKCYMIRVPTSLFFIFSLFSEAVRQLARKPDLLGLEKCRDLIQPLWQADVRKAAELLSFTPRYSLEKAIEETVAWYTAKEWL